MVDRGYANFDGLEVLIRQVNVLQHAAKQRRLLFRLSRATVGKALAMCVRFRKIVLVGPSAGFDEMIDVRSISAVSIREDTQGCRFEAALVLRHKGLRIAPDVVEVQRLVGAGGEIRSFRKQLDLQREQITEDAR